MSDSTRVCKYLEIHFDISSVRMCRCMDVFVLLTKLINDLKLAKHTYKMRLWNKKHKTTSKTTTVTTTTMKSKKSWSRFLAKAYNLISDALHQVHHKMMHWLRSVNGIWRFLILSSFYAWCLSLLFGLVSFLFFVFFFFLFGDNFELNV